MNLSFKEMLIKVLWLIIEKATQNYIQQKYSRTARPFIQEKNHLWFWSHLWIRKKHLLTILGNLKISNAEIVQLYEIFSGAPFTILD